MRPASVSIGVLAALFAATGAAAPTPAADGPIQIVSALYGPRNTSHPADFAARLQTVCGSEADHCEAFCSPSFLGVRDYSADLFRLEGRRVCRIIYRCGGGQATLSSETYRNDTILLSCHAQP
jgi:hypothetical protein